MTFITNSDILNVSEILNINLNINDGGFGFMLVSATEMLKKAKEGHYAVGQFNINNLEWTKSILQTAQELNSPVILGELVSRTARLAAVAATHY